MKPVVTGFDFFAGCGGFSCGMISAGIHVVGALEFDCSASHTYMANLCSHPLQIWYTSEEYREKMTKYFDKSFKKTGTVEKSGSAWPRHWTRKGLKPVSNFFFGDIKEISGAQILEAIGMERGELGCIFGGPPCQGLSTANSKARAGLNKGYWDPRNDLIFEFAYKIVEMWPQTFTMENVPGIAKAVCPDGTLILDKFMYIIQMGGYMNSEQVQKALKIY